MVLGHNPWDGDRRDPRDKINDKGGNKDDKQLLQPSEEQIQYR